MTTLHEAGALTQQAGTFIIQIITPGRGSSGTYPASTIEAAGRDRIFRAGTPMFIDHATSEESMSRPEGSLHNLAAVLTEDAHWDGERLQAPVKVFERWRSTLADMRDHIGVSIRATGEVEESADGPIITRLTAAQSVDFVTKAGRGGKILEVLESARDDVAVLEEVAEALHPQDHQPPAGKETAVSDKKGSHMTTIQIDEADHKALVEKAGRADTLESQLAESQKKIEALEAAQAEAERRDHVTALIEAQLEGVDVPAVVIESVTTAHMGADVTDEAITNAAKQIAESYTPTDKGVHGLGHSSPVNEAAEASADYAESVLAALKGDH